VAQLVGLSDEALCADDGVLRDIEEPGDEELAALAQSVVREALRQGRTLGCAESCTGGLVAGAICGVAGCSEVMRGGVVSYALEVKRDVLGVSWELLCDPMRGAVSRECAAQMAAGARRALDCDVAVSVTGIAGPGGAEPGKPVGTVWIGVASDDRQTEVRFELSGERNSVRTKAVALALRMLREAL
jgi:nicotinamide-nucleotide amidase